MSPLDVSKPGPEERTRHSESDMTTIGDLVVWHQMPFLSVRMLTQLNCPRWSIWDPHNIKRIAEARTLDETRDWYFPIVVRMEKGVTERIYFLDAAPMRLVIRDPEVDTDIAFPSLPIKDVWSSWSGVWHSDAQHASGMTRPLPPITHLPHEWLHHRNPRDDVIASAGGLLLIKGKRGGVPIRRSKRLNPVLADLNPSSISDTTKLAAGTSKDPIRNRKPQLWKRLLVCNPLTRECRELPAADCRLLGLQSWEFVYEHGVQASLVVNQEANSYQVVLTSKDVVAVYTSNSNSWNCLRFPQERPWRRSISPIHSGVFVRWDYICASAHAGGRLYFADVQSTTRANEGMEPSQKAINAGTLRLFEVDAGAGKWQAVHEYTLRKFHIPSLKHDIKHFSYDMGILPYLNILECNGDLYAVLPAKVHDAWLIGEDQPPHDWMPSEDLGSVDDSGREYVSMPLCFYIMQLQGHGTDWGVLQIQLARDHTDYDSRVRRLVSLASAKQWLFKNFFSCEARGSVIWVACEDYVLSFDVVSRESRTLITAMHNSTRYQFGHETLGFAYRPSLHMKP